MSAADLMARIDVAKGDRQRASDMLAEARGMGRREEPQPTEPQGGGLLDALGGISGIGHTVLDVAGFIPVVGAVADLANAGWYAAEGDYVNAGLSAVGAIPFAGDAATAAKLGAKGVDAAAGIARNADNATDVARSGDDITREISGQRKPNTTRIGDEDAARLRGEFEEVGGDPKDFRINQGGSTHYDDATNKVNVGGNIFPNPHSNVPRSMMSSKAVLAHELGHQAYPIKGETGIQVGDWRDEFRASYHAARHAPSLSDQERLHLVEDAISRAREAGAAINPNGNKFIRETRGFDY